MTKITRKTVRETTIDYRGEKLCVELLPRTMLVWPYRRRHDGVFVSYEAIYELGLKLAARRAGPGQHPTSKIQNRGSR